ncbi:MAG TPA: hypothetical protein VL443_24230 [Cyclobacteriaceae bacterium]|jgi:hypothetical protein|nr:hypothetical protein [Cyclobacteriaceae bacterium]
MLTGKIDCSKIEKARLFNGKDGAKYLDIILIPTPNDKHGNDYMIVQSITKEERAAGQKGKILGNAKELGQRSNAPQQGNDGWGSAPSNSDIDGLPF